LETHTRTIVKSLTWRAGGFVMTTLVALVVTGKIELAASIGVLDTVIKVAAFYAHERVWLRIRFGRKPLDYEI
jgi:uncharacterized membrane protein